MRTKLQPIFSRPGTIDEIFNTVEVESDRVGERFPASETQKNTVLLQVSPNLEREVRSFHRTDTFRRRQSTSAGASIPAATSGDRSARNYRGANPVIGARNTCQQIIGITTMAAHYAWTLRYHGRQNILKVTTIAGLEKVLAILELPGLPRPDLLAERVVAAQIGSYTHCHRDDERWSLTWTTIDDPA